VTACEEAGSGRTAAAGAANDFAARCRRVFKASLALSALAQGDRHNPVAMRAVAWQAMAQLKRLRLRPLTCQFTAQQLPCVIIMACRCVLFFGSVRREINKTEN
jgi:hypothetical protein